MHELLRHQAGVVSRAQLLTLGHQPHDVARLVRRRELTRVHPGVYLEHTGEPTWLQLAWAAVLHCQHGAAPESAALHGCSALAAFEGRSGPARDVIEVVIADDRKVRAPKGVAVLRSTATLSHAQWHLRPPRVRYEAAVVEVASRHRRMVDLVAEVARAVASRRTTPARLRALVDELPRVPHRDRIVAVLSDVGTGSCSVLEHGYLTRVERAHRLPVARRQARATSRTSVTYRDADYDGVVVELDGRLWHDSVEQRDRDADRDLVAAADGAATVRLTWGQVFDRPCWTAAQIARLLGVQAGRCGPQCAVQETKSEHPVHQVNQKFR